MLERAPQYYAQFREDESLRRFFPKKDNGFYIDIGAWDANVDSVTKHFYDAGWHGINIEPIPAYHERILTFRPHDINLEIAVGDQNELKKMSYIHDTGLSTFHAENAKLYSTNRQVDDIYVTTLTLKRVCQLYVPPSQEIDFLKIDVEGWELQVLSGADFIKYRPKVILLEATVPGTSGPTAIMAPDRDLWFDLLKSNDYDFAHFDGLNDFFYDRQWKGIPPTAIQ